VLSLYLLLATVLAGSTGKARNVRHIGYGAHNQNVPGSPGYNAPVPQPRGYPTVPVPNNGGSPKPNYYNRMNDGSAGYPHNPNGNPSNNYVPQIVYHAPAPTMTTYTIHNYHSPAPIHEGPEPISIPELHPYAYEEHEDNEEPSNNHDDPASSYNPVPTYP
ncbi:unnamed protein product, partial [Allacma fusca]